MKKRQSKAYLNKLKTPRTSLKHRFRVLHYNITHNEEYSPFPLYAKIEINGQCNLDCVMCLRTSLDNRNRFMSLNEFSKVLDHLPQLIQWSPHGYNEPLLHPQFFDFVREAHKRDIGLVLVTNATLLDMKKSIELLQFKVDRIIISIDAVGGRYEEIRKKAKYDEVIQNITALLNVNRNVLPKPVPVSLAATIWKDNIDQIPELINLARHLHIPISFSDITWTYEYKESKKELSIRENVPLESLQDVFEQYTGDPLVKFGITKKGKKERTCTLPWSSVYVDVVGGVYPCTDNLDYKCGNLFRTHIHDIYNNELYKKFRVGSLYGHEERYNCLNCAAWGATE